MHKVANCIKDNILYQISLLLLSGFCQARPVNNETARVEAVMANYELTRPHTEWSEILQVILGTLTLAVMSVFIRTVLKHTGINLQNDHGATYGPANQKNVE